jgi:hypothetical protein
MAFIEIPTGPNEKSLINIDYIVRIDGDATTIIQIYSPMVTKSISCPLSLKQIYTLIYNATHN